MTPPANRTTRRRFAGSLTACALVASGLTPDTADAVAAAPMAPHLQSLGWWMRRTSSKAMAEVRPYYETVLGLPLVRAWENDLVLLWAGEDHVFEVKTDDHPLRSESDPDRATCIPVFRSHDLTATAARMATFGFTPVSQRATRWGRTIFYRGPDALITGFEERAVNSPFAADKKALAQWRRGPSRLADLPPLPSPLHYLSRAIRHVANVQGMSTWYRDVFGLKPIGAENGSQLFALGDDVTFEIAPGGAALPEPGDRSELPDSYVLRVHELDRVMLGLQQRHARFNGPLIVKEETTRLQYVADPEGWLTGIEERGRIRPQYVDDVEAQRRWRARRE